MIENQPITPPPELVKQWTNNAHLSQPNMGGICHEVATQAARWGADQELEACVNYVDNALSGNKARALRAARRPKPLSLKEQALEILNAKFDGLPPIDADIIRRALEQLND